MKKLLLTTALVLGVANTLHASEVYIDQAGNGTNVNVLQQNGKDQHTI